MDAIELPLYVLNLGEYYLPLVTFKTPRKSWRWNVTIRGKLLASSAIRPDHLGFPVLWENKDPTNHNTLGPIPAKTRYQDKALLLHCSDGISIHWKHTSFAWYFYSRFPSGGKPLLGAFPLLRCDWLFRAGDNVGGDYSTPPFLWLQQLPSPSATLIKKNIQSCLPLLPLSALS